MDNVQQNLVTRYPTSPKMHAVGHKSLRASMILVSMWEKTKGSNGAHEEPEWQEPQKGQQVFLKSTVGKLENCSWNKGLKGPTVRSEGLEHRSPYALSKLTLQAGSHTEEKPLGVGSKLRRTGNKDKREGSDKSGRGNRAVSFLIYMKTTEEELWS